MTKRSHTGAKSASKKRKSKDDVWDDSDALIWYGNSPLYEYNTDISNLIRHPSAEAILSTEEASFPPADLSREQLRRALTDFQNDGRNGFNDADYLTQAVTASAHRRNGEFDEFIDAQFNENWVDPDSPREYPDDETESSEEKHSKDVEKHEMQNGSLEMQSGAQMYQTQDGNELCLPNRSCGPVDENEPNSVDHEQMLPQCNSKTESSNLNELGVSHSCHDT